MKKFELLKYLETLDDNAEICITDLEQNNNYEIKEVRTTDKDTSYADLAVDIPETKIKVIDISESIKDGDVIKIYSLQEFMNEINLAPEFMDFNLENVRFEIESVQNV